MTRTQGYLLHNSKKICLNSQDRLHTLNQLEESCGNFANEDICAIFLCVQLTLLLRMDDKMNRQLTCDVSTTDSGYVLAEELVHFGFINSVSSTKAMKKISLTTIDTAKSL